MAAVKTTVLCAHSQFTNSVNTNDNNTSYKIVLLLVHVMTGGGIIERVSNHVLFQVTTCTGIIERVSNHMIV
jgi:hypothetical protein